MEEASHTEGFYPPCGTPEADGVPDVVDALDFYTTDNYFNNGRIPKRTFSVYIRMLIEEDMKKAGLTKSLVLERLYRSQGRLGTSKSPEQ